jgi:serine/threonine protein kinase
VQDDFRKEVAIMSTLRHPNVLLFMGACTQPGNLLIVTELMPRGSVYDLLRDRSLKLSLKRKMLFAKDAALGVNWLHRSKPQFLHLDLKVFFSSVCRALVRVVSCLVVSCSAMCGLTCASA